MSRSLVGGIKRAAQELNQNEKLCDLSYGTVISANPIKVQVTNLLTIPTALLVVPQHLTDYEVEVTVDWVTATDTHTHDASNQDGTECTLQSNTHSHAVSGMKKMTIHNALKVGDKVALLRKQGGQSYFIIDRI